MANLATLMVKIGADISELERGLSKVSRSVEDAGKRMTQMGKTISTRVTAPLTALGAVAVRAFGQQEKAELTLRAALQANGREVDNLFNRYSEFASEMQRVSVVGDETTLAMLSQAESFGLTADSAERAVRNSIAMQSAFGVNAQSALRYTAALEEGNATMLTRYIPSLREISDESERVAEAQRILGNAFSAAEAEAQGSTGQMIQMKNAIGDFMEVVGEVISDAILPFVRRIKELAEAAQNLNPEIIKIGVGIAAAVAVIGPALIILGQLAIAISAIISPVGLVIAAIAGLSAAILYVSQNWDAVVERISDWAWWRNMLVDMAQFFIEHSPFGLVIKGVNAVLRFMGKAEIPNPFKGLADSLEGLKVETKEYEHEFGSFMDAVKGGFASVTGLDLSSPFSNAKPEIDSATQSVQDYTVSIERATLATQRLSSTQITPPEVRRAVVETTGILGGMQNRITGLREALMQANTWEGIRRIRSEIADLELAMTGMTQAGVFAMDVANSFTQSFGQGMANVVLQGERLIDTLKNIGKLLASAVIQKALSVFLTGGLGGGGFFGSGGGLFGKIFGVNDALITSGGDVVKFHPDDNILAMKDFGNLGGAQHVTVSGRIDGNDILLSNSRSERFFR